jgi:phage gp29-like protein
VNGLAPELPFTAPAAVSGDAQALRRLIWQRLPLPTFLQPATLKAALDQFDRGGLRDFARTAEYLTSRHPVVTSVVAKREKDVGRLNYTILPNAEVAEADRAAAEAHREALEYFYRHLEATELLNRDATGGVHRLFRQLARCLGHKWSVHEITWLPTPDGRLTARFIHWPLWMFEALTGRLRWLPEAGLAEGCDMASAEWLVAAGDGLLRATAFLVSIRDGAVADWAGLCERFGIPFVLGKTPAAKNSDQWAAMKEMVASFAGDGGGVCSADAMVELVQASLAGSAPHGALAQYCDDWITILWRGANLSTKSRQNSQGASVQDSEADLLLEDDAALLTETLQQRLDPLVIAWRFGAGVQPLAHIVIQPPLREDIQTDLQIDETLLRLGLRLKKSELLDRYDRSEGADAADRVAPAEAASNQ